MRGRERESERESESLAEFTEFVCVRSDGGVSGRTAFREYSAEQVVRMCSSTCFMFRELPPTPIGFKPSTFSRCPTLVGGGDSGAAASTPITREPGCLRPQTEARRRLSLPLLPQLSCCTLSARNWGEEVFALRLCFPLKRRPAPRSGVNRFRRLRCPSPPHSPPPPPPLFTPSPGGEPTAGAAAERSFNILSSLC